MKHTYLIIGFLLISLCSTAQTKIPFTLSPNGHILFHAEINGVDGLFIFDTGAGINVVTKRYFDKLKGITSDNHIFTGFRATGERMDVALYKADTMVIGNFTCKSIDLCYLNVDDWDEDGIISLKNFEYNPVTINYNTHELIIHDLKRLPTLKKNSKHIVPLQLDNSRDIALGILCYVNLNDTLKAQFVMDSGAGKNVCRINARYMPALHIDTLDTDKVKKITFKSELKAGHENYIYHTTLPKISVTDHSRISRQPVKVQFVEGLIYDGIMSPEWLGKVITISVPTRELIISE